jgi:hypothetical protein
MVGNVQITNKSGVRKNSSNNGGETEDNGEISNLDEKSLELLKLYYSSDYDELMKHVNNQIEKLNDLASTSDLGEEYKRLVLDKDRIEKRLEEIRNEVEKLLKGNDRDNQIMKMRVYNEDLLNMLNEVYLMKYHLMDKISKNKKAPLPLTTTHANAGDGATGKVEAQASERTEVEEIIPIEDGNRRNGNNDGGNGNTVKGGTKVNKGTEGEEITPIEDVKSENGNGNNGNNSNTRNFDEDSIISDFADLLVAKERLKRSIYDKYILAHENSIKEQFKLILAKNSAKGKEAVIAVLKKVNKKMAEKRGNDKRLIYRISRAWRRYRFLIPTIAIAGLAFGGTLLASGFVVAGTSFIAGAAALRGVSTYAGFNALWTTVQKTFSVRVGKKEKKLGAALIFNDEKQIEKLAQAQAEIDDTVEEIVSYAGKYRKWKIAKHALAALAGISAALVAFSPFKTSVVSLIENKALTGGSVVNADILTAHKGEGIWHISERALRAHYGEAFNRLSIREKNVVIDALKDAIIRNPAAAGIDKGEMLDVPISKGGPWLKLNATLEKLADKKVVDAMLGKYKALLAH